MKVFNDLIAEPGGHIHITPLKPIADYIGKKEVKTMPPRLRRNLRKIQPDLPENHVNDKRAYYWSEYLKSDHWSDLRARKLKASPVCEKCGSNKRIEPHHLRYKNLFDVELEDLMTLCRKCHRSEHQKITAEKPVFRRVKVFAGWIGRNSLKRRSHNPHDKYGRGTVCAKY